MTVKSYADLMKSIFEMILHEIRNNPDYDWDEYLEGQEAGLMLAIDKIEASRFLFERG